RFRLAVSGGIRGRDRGGGHGLRLIYSPTQPRRSGYRETDRRTTKRADRGSGDGASGNGLGSAAPDRRGSSVSDRDCVRKSRRRPTSSIKLRSQMHTTKN